MLKNIKIAVVTLVAFIFLANNNILAISSTFKDVPTTAWYYDSVEKLVSSKVVDKGDYYYPNRSLNRAELVKMVMTASSGLTGYKAPSTPTFTDVPKTAWYYDHVETAVQLGVVSGYKDASGKLTGKFGPQDTVNRAAATKILVNSFSVPTTATPASKFSDVAKTDWFHDYVVTAYNQSVLDGYSNGKFGPADAVTRAQTAKMVVNAQNPAVRTPSTSTSTTSSSSGSSGGSGSSGIVNSLSLSKIKFWAYQLQGVDYDGAVDTLAKSNYDMLVIEPTRTDWSSDNKNFDTKSMVAKLKNTKASDGIHRKLVMAYIDIGEAEDWRWYWTWSKKWKKGTSRPSDWPNYILTHDPDGWDGNYPVAYWDSKWKDITIYGKNQDSKPYGDYNSVIDEAIKDGFDGIYLDWVEAFDNADVIKEAKKQGKNPAAEMIKFIKEMKDYAKKRNPNFLIIQQNAAELYTNHPELFGYIDAISQEAIWYDGSATDDNWDNKNGYDIAQKASLTNYYIKHLDKYKKEGLPVFNCEYALKKANDAYSKSYNKSYIPYVSRRSLSKLTTTPSQNYGESVGSTKLSSVWANDGGYKVTQDQLIKSKT